MKERLIKFIEELKSLNKDRTSEKKVNHRYSIEIRNILDIKINTTNHIIKGLEKLISSDDEYNNKVKEVIKVFDNIMLKL